MELLAVLAVAGIAMATASLYLRPMEAPVLTAAAELEGFLKQARARALATTSACRVLPVTSGNLRVECAANCGATGWTVDPGPGLALPRDVTMTDTSWTACFTSRGLSTGNLTITLAHPDYRSQRVEVLLGGAARTVP